MEVKIISVEVVSGNLLKPNWKNPMQKICTDKGLYISTLDYDWKTQIGSTVNVSINKSCGYNWINIENYTSIQKTENFIFSKNEEIQKEKLPEGYNLNDNPELKQTYEYIKQNIPVIFLTGGAGTGKSTFIKYLKNNLKKDTGKNCVVLAPTGVAAINAGGQTICSFFHWNNDAFKDEEVTKGLYINPVAEHTDLFIIDEISMVHSWMIDHIDYALRLWCDNNKPFGGKQLLLIGDCFQLPPIVDDKNEKQKEISKKYKSPFFFAANTFEKFATNEKKALQLKKIYRQENDQYFIHILNRIRECKPGYEQDIAYLNKSCFIETLLRTKNVPLETIILCTTNNKAERFNIEKFSALQEKGAKSIEFRAFIQGDFDLDSVITPNPLKICIGAKIMVTKNIKDKNLVNGDIGKVLEFGGTGKSYIDYVDVEVKGQRHHLTRETWQKSETQWDNVTQTTKDKIVGTFNQIPLMLGWAVTIHKSQGLTLNSVAIDADDAWAPGQIYVALSRARTLDGILLTKMIPSSKVIVNKYIQKKYKELFPNDEIHTSVDIENDHKRVLSNDSFTIDKSENKTSVEISGINIDLYPKDGEKIQDKVKRTMKILLSNNLIPEFEMKRLLNDKEYCYQTFGINVKKGNYIFKYTLLKKEKEAFFDNYSNQYKCWKDPIEGYYICAQWYKPCLNKFADWLVFLSKINEPKKKTLLKKKKKVMGKQIIGYKIASRTPVMQNGYCKFKLQNDSYVLIDDKGMHNSSLPWTGKKVSIKIFKEEDNIITEWKWEEITK